MTRADWYTRAELEARELHDIQISDIHLLMAALRESPARTSAALGALGLDVERVKSTYVQERPKLGSPIRQQPETQRLAASAPLWTSLGRADGFAQGRGAEQLRPEDVILAVIWDAQTTVAWVLKALAVARERIHAASVSIEPALAATKLPAEPRVDWAPRVFVDRTQLPRLLRALPPLLPPDTPLSFNYEADGRAWIRTVKGIDLESLVRRVFDPH